MLRVAAALVVSTSLLTFAGAAAAAGTHPGEVETRIATLYNQKLYWVGTAADGRIFAAGQYHGDYPAGPNSWVRAYEPGGAPDTGFGQGGLVDFPAGGPQLTGMAVQRDGGVVAGLTGRPPVLMRLAPDGSVDRSFGTDGRIELGAELDAPLSLTDLELEPDGRILVALVESAGALQVRRYLATGTPDTSFGTEGIARLPAVGGTDPTLALALQRDGIVVAALASSQDNRSKFGRLLADGSLDASFGPGGLAEIELADHAWASELAEPAAPITLRDGRIRVPFRFGGPRAARQRIALVGLTEAGHPDLHFGDRGLALGPRPSCECGEAVSTAIADERGGAIVAGEHWRVEDFSGSDGAILRRFRADGKLDRSFGTRGLLRWLPGQGYSAFGQALTMLDADTLVLGGYEWNAKYGDWHNADLRTLNAGYDDDGPAISVVSGCRFVRVRVRDHSALDGVVVKAGGRVVRRTDRKRFRIRTPHHARSMSIRATDLAGNTSRVRTRLPRC